MGGSALKHCTGRFDRRKYDIDLSLIRSDLRFLFGGVRVEDIPFYRNKKTFGDMDILISSDGLPSDWIERLVNYWQPADYQKNSNVLSIEFDGIQVDLIVTSPDNFDTSLLYFAYNDLGNLMGRIAHKMGMKYGHDGLSYCFRDGDNLVKTIQITKNQEFIFSILGYEYERWLEGFDELEDIFVFASSTPFFNPNIYLLDNRNHISKMRDRKRPSYMKFLEWCKENRAFDRADWVPFETDKRLYLPYIFDNFPVFKIRYNEVERELKRKKDVKLRFNGNTVGSITGMEGKDLGALMSWMRRNGWEGEQFIDWVLAASVEEIVDEVRYAHEKWVNE